jgi:ribonuclease Z
MRVIKMRKKILVTAICLAALGLTNAATAAPVIKVTLLGTGVPLLNAEKLDANGRALSGLLIEAGSERMLFDVGQGVYSRLVESGGGMQNPNVGVDKVFISHLHSDHIADLAPLYVLGGLYRHPDSTDVLGINNDLSIYPFPTKTPLRVWGPAAGPNQPVGTWAMMQSFRSAYQTDFYVRNLWSGWDASVGYGAIDTMNNTVTEMAKDGVVYSNNGVKVTAFLVNHKPLSPSFGYKVEYQGKSVVYSGDTAPNPNIVKYAKGADVLIHEVYGYPAAAAPNIYAYHTSPEDFAKQFKDAGVKQAVYTHLVMQPNFSTDPNAPTPNSSPDLIVAATKAAGYTGKLAAGVDLTVINVGATGVTVTQPSSAKAMNARKAKSHALEVVQPHND